MYKVVTLANGKKVYRIKQGQFFKWIEEGKEDVPGRHLSEVEEQEAESLME